MALWLLLEVGSIKCIGYWLYLSLLLLGFASSLCCVSGNVKDESVMGLTHVCFPRKGKRNFMRMECCVYGRAQLGLGLRRVHYI